MSNEFNSNNSEPETTNLLRDVIQRLESAELTACEMEHEKIRRGPDGFVPLLNPAVEHGFMRVEYCPFALRKKRLGCAHTPIRTELIRDLHTISLKFPENELLKANIRELETLDRAIIDVDWKKSDLELDDARQSAALNDQHRETEKDGAALAKLNQTQQQIEAAIDQHTQYLQQLNRWQTSTLEELKRIDVR